MHADDLSLEHQHTSATLHTQPSSTVGHPGMDRRALTLARCWSGAEENRTGETGAVARLPR
ncbi:hypothetical protein CTI14_27630 [Methylobacterium radiotolerans]|nr:hypothetical protein CTI14_27630 [Methylobacterium radiotolerans]